MARLTIYIDKQTKKSIEIAARRAETSVSRWARERLQDVFDTEWPEGYFELLGALSDSDLERPAWHDGRTDP